GEGTLTYALIRSRLENLRLVGQFEARDVDTDIAGSEFTRDRLRIARVGLSYDLTDTWNGINAVRVTLHKGLDLAGATQQGDTHASRANGRSDFFKLTTELTRVQQLGTRSSLMATLAAQWTPNAMLASEEMALGGASFARAYDEGEISADRGVAAALELRYSPEIELLPHGSQLYGFLDGGRLSATTEGAPLTGARSLASFGFGARANLWPGVLATLEVAKPISAEVRTEGNKNARAFVSLTAQF
ncbi:MAG TPA: ShlB/FhaC/HecB family hemolysin secretion/activation protein, partial [Rhizobacter sp.]|nr:ShlB/FhaC/HecB family hemolysin secretion/activation protein [Rhizobacter sp.]